MHLPDLTSIEHRPWPIPELPWTWQQAWYDLLFAHWPIELDALRPLIPDELEIDTHEGTAWIGVVPFNMRIKRRGLPGIPTAAHFPELNVRTYVKLAGKPGVWFFSLDAASRLAVWGARRYFHLPYYHADMRIASDGDAIVYHSARRGPQPAAFAARYRPIVPVTLAQHGSLEHWLTERYCLFARSKSGVYWCGEIHHEPWPLQQAEAEITQNSMLEPLGLRVPDTQPVLHFAKSIDVALWPLSKAKTP
ncbi:YqjF family protein [Aeoliella sp.]|uniref:YqjF family protein n=1 Tax=Aeoliella sp. TaxID=2795800 RepID=UPI003CCBD2C1